MDPKIDSIVYNTCSLLLPVCCFCFSFCSSFPSRWFCCCCCCSQQPTRFSRAPIELSTSTPSSTVHVPAIILKSTTAGWWHFPFSPFLFSSLLSSFSVRFFPSPLNLLHSLSLYYSLHNLRHNLPLLLHLVNIHRSRSLPCFVCQVCSKQYNRTPTPPPPPPFKPQSKSLHSTCMKEEGKLSLIGDAYRRQNFAALAQTYRDRFIVSPTSVASPPTLCWDFPKIVKTSRGSSRRRSWWEALRCSAHNIGLQCTPVPSLTAPI